MTHLPVLTHGIDVTPARPARERRSSIFAPSGPERAGRADTERRCRHWRGDCVCCATMRETSLFLAVAALVFSAVAGCGGNVVVDATGGAGGGGPTGGEGGGATTTSITTTSP